MLKIHQARLQQCVNREFPDVQTGFRKGKGTRDQIPNILWIIGKKESSRKTFTSAFLTKPKTLYRSQQTMEDSSRDGNARPLTCLLRNLYASQEATVRTGHRTTDWFQTGKGVCQGCILSPCLFNLYAEYIMRNSRMDEAQAGIRIAGSNINNLRYTDDTTFMAES